MSLPEPPAAPPTYSFRSLRGFPELTFSLQGADLVIGRPDGGEGRVPLAEIERVVLRRYRLDSVPVVECRLQRRGGEFLVLRDAHFREKDEAGAPQPGGAAAFAHVEHRTARFEAFVRALHAALAAGGRPVRFQARAGEGFGSRVAKAVLGAGGATSVVWVLAGKYAIGFVGLLFAFPVSLAASLGAGAVVMAALMPGIVRARPRRYSPDAIPIRFLPPAAPPAEENVGGAANAPHPGSLPVRDLPSPSHPTLP